MMALRFARQKCIFSFSTFIILVMASGAVLAKTKVQAVHVRYQYSNAFELRSQAEARQQCKQFFKKDYRVVGDVEKAKTGTIDEYYSANGQYMAKYTNGYSLDYQDSGCLVSVVKHQDIQIYHIKAQNHYAYTSKKDRWIKREMVNMVLGGKAVGLMGRAFENVNGKAHYIGDDKVAGLRCKRYALKDVSWCEWKKTDGNYKGFVAPQQLQLRSKMGKGKQERIVNVEHVNFKAEVNLKLFKAPESFDEVGVPAQKSKNEDVYAWCRAQKKKLGKNVCDGMEDD